jgi:hypothetical protein
VFDMKPVLLKDVPPIDVVNLADWNGVEVELI